MKNNRYFSNGNPGQDIVMTKWTGLKGTAIIAMEKEQELLQRYNKSFLEAAKSMTEHALVERETRIAKKVGVTSVHKVEKGGIFATLWDIGKSYNKGLEVDLNKILIKQETVEVCEFYNINPYMLISSGCMVMVTDKGNYLVERLLAEGVMAAVIGWLTDSNDRVIINGEECRYLMPPKGDELYKVVDYKET